MKWKKEKPLDSCVLGCLLCGYTRGKLSMRTKIVAGFSDNWIKKNSEVVYQAPDNDLNDWDTAPTLMKFENMARKDPDNDWRYWINQPLREAEYQRQGKNEWVLIRTWRGFA